MKKLSVLTGFVGFLALASCAKDYDCACLYTGTVGTDTTYTTHNDLRNTKKAAQDNCDALSGKAYSGSYEFDVTCTLNKK